MKVSGSWVLGALFSACAAAIAGGFPAQDAEQAFALAAPSSASPISGAEVRLELARIELELAIGRDFDAAGARLDRLWLGAARAQAFDGRWEVLARIAEARAELALERGDLEAARRAAERLLPRLSDLEGAGARDGFEPAGQELATGERAALAGARLGALRARIAAAGPAAPSSEQLAAELASDPWLARVQRALDERDEQLLETLGDAAVLALARLCELGLDRGIADPAQDPLIPLVERAPILAATLVLDTLDRAGASWRQRVLRAMRRSERFERDDDWDASVSPPRSLRPQWILVLERIAEEPEHLRAALPFARAILQQGASTEQLVVALSRALRSRDADLAQEALEVVRVVFSMEPLAPLYADLLADPRSEVRVLAVAKLASLRDVRALEPAARDEDPEVRLELARHLARSAKALDAEQRALAAELAADADARVRGAALAALLEGGGAGVEPELLRRAARDPQAGIRAMLARTLALPDARLSSELFLQLAQDPAPEVLAELDARVSRGARAGTQLPMGAELVLLRARWSALGREQSIPDGLERALQGLAHARPGSLALARWALAEGDPRLFQSLVQGMRTSVSAATALLQLEEADLGRLFVELGAFELRGGTDARRAADLLESLARAAGLARPARVEALRSVLADGRAGELAKLRAMQALALSSESVACADLLSLARSPRWSDPGRLDAAEPEPAPGRRALAPRGPELERALAQLASAMAPAARNRCALALVEDEGNADAAAATFASAFDPRAELCGELVSAILGRWLEPAGERVGAVVSALRALGPQRARPELVALALRNPAYTLEAVRALGNAPERAEIELLGECIEASWLEGRQRTEVQKAAIAALAGSASDEAARLLAERARVLSDPELRELCIAALEQFRRLAEGEAWIAARERAEESRAQALAAVEALLGESEEQLVVEGVQAAASLGARELLPRLVELLRSPRPPVRAAVQAALDRLGRAERR